MNEKATVKKLILDILRECGECGAVATHIGDDGMYNDDLACCDKCYDNLLEGLWNEDTKYEEKIRALMAITEKW